MLGERARLTEYAQYDPSYTKFKIKQSHSAGLEGPR